jgi:hypothetical protein
VDRDDSPLPPRRRGRLKGSKNKPKDPKPVTIRLGLESYDQIDQGLSSQGSEMAPNQGDQDQTPLDLSNQRVTRSRT